MSITSAIPGQPGETYPDGFLLAYSGAGQHVVAIYRTIPWRFGRASATARSPCFSTPLANRAIANEERAVSGCGIIAKCLPSGEHRAVIPNAEPFGFEGDILGDHSTVIGESDRRQVLALNLLDGNRVRTKEPTFTVSHPNPKD